MVRTRVKTRLGMLTIRQQALIMRDSTTAARAGRWVCHLSFVLWCELGLLCAVQRRRYSRQVPPDGHATP
jgi:hypothetical protein